MTAFHERLRTLRKRSGWTMRELARRLEVPETTYRDWEYGRSIQGAELYVKLSDTLEIPLWELMGGKAQKKSLIAEQLAKTETQFSQLRRSVMSLL